MSQPGLGNFGNRFAKSIELRNRLLFLLGALIVYRVGCYVPVPGVNPEAMLALMQKQGGGIVDMFNMFSGGALHRFSIFALNVMPYISASIVVQLATHIFPSLKAMQKEGESGRRKITQYSRIGAVILAVIQGGSIALALQNQTVPGGAAVVYAPGAAFVMTAIVALTAGTVFLMWVGEQVTERGIGNGVSMIIFAGIVAGLPGSVLQTIDAFRSDALSLISLLIIVFIVLSFTFFVVFVERGLRRITVNYARRVEGRNSYMNKSSFLPLKLNMAGVIPPIFASSILAFPVTLSMWSGQASSNTLFGAWLQRVSSALGPGEPLHMILFAVLIIGFAFFYTALVFSSQETADILKKSGALIPGIRPGKATSDYVDGVLTRLTAVGSLYLVIVCLLPEFMQSRMGASFHFGGTSLLIAVVVVMDFISQIQVHQASNQYDGVSFFNKANLKGVSKKRRFVN
ncbi:preprotein translocase subunit SecY [Xylella fastidiosa subsp. fastidiosa]|uniref:preprotein translocase subunit SecY n=1 Tax=Xylella fastidiosa TaxID=2371 RepID=UPI000FFF637C|nr:preprotein translocase subunit SecY [Xylella fastidiosa]RWA42459.1 preprotein translocase subunit SecY [Xylella fastidiosa subsp. fastidiosa]